MTMEPCCRSILWGTTALTDCQTPVMLMSSISCQVSRVISCTGTRVQIPGFTIRQSIWPSYVMPSAMAESRAVWSRTSASIDNALRSRGSTYLTVSAMSSAVGVWVGNRGEWLGRTNENDVCALAC